MIPDTALVLVGGFGTRLRPVVSSLPKALAPVAGRPFLAWQLEALAAQGIRRVVLCTHHLADLIEQHFPAGPSPHGPEIIHSREHSPLGTGGGLRLGLEAARTDRDAVLALNGDTFCRFDLGVLHQACRDRGARAGLVLTRVEDAARFGTVETDHTGAVMAFREKTGKAVPGTINAGIYLFVRSELERLPMGLPVSVEQEVFPRMIGNGLFAWPLGSDFLDIGTPESYARADAMVPIQT